MSRACSITGRTKAFGNKVSHSNRKTKRTFLLNLHNVSLKSEILNKKFKERIATKALRTIDYKGGFDQYLLSTDNKNLSLKAQKIRRKLKKLIPEEQKVEIQFKSLVLKIKKIGVQLKGLAPEKYKMETRLKCLIAKMPKLEVQLEKVGSRIQEIEVHSEESDSKLQKMKTGLEELKLEVQKAKVQLEKIISKEV